VGLWLRVWCWWELMRVRVDSRSVSLDLGLVHFEVVLVQALVVLLLRLEARLLEVVFRDGLLGVRLALAIY